MYLIPGTPEHALHLVKIGQRSQLPGICRCMDCGEPFIYDYSGIKYCPEHRPDHDRICQQCGTYFVGPPEGHRLCPCCREQKALF